MSQRENPSYGQASLPTVFQCNAAFWAAKALDVTGSTQEALNKSYNTLPTGGLYDQRSLLAGQQLLLGYELIEQRGALLFPGELLVEWQGMPIDPFTELLVEHILVKRKDLWLPSLAGEDQVFWERVPNEATRLLQSTFLEQEQRDAFVLSVARKVDIELLNAIGAEGEETVVSDCRKYLADRGREDLAVRVVRVSLRDDTLGYDVSSPDCTGRLHHLEVKATRSLGESVDFYISRGEAEKGQADPMWALVVVRQDIISSPDNMSMRVAGWLPYGEIAPSLPADAPPRPNRKGKWQSARISVPEGSLFDGLPFDR
ncbi:DUF3883 domain-containing protein [Amycolatopsis sp. NPDC051128]|uniref:protein NO VEIN domain-containing protein n=1 Tax=Amycolatopsis sp. NPDC051128 TaxID=3155412 RepID=UPI003417FAEE